MTTILATLIASFIIALISFVGRFTLFQAPKGGVSGAYAHLLPISIGAFAGVAFLDLIPEAVEATEYAGVLISLGFFGFFLLSRVLHEYHHHHDDGCDDVHATIRARGPIVLTGNALHIFVDGVIIASAFAISFPLGIATTFAVALHEVPRQVAEMYVLVNAGYSRAKALTLNFISTLAVVVGSLAGIFFIEYVEHSLGIILSIAAGNLVYIVASDLLPSLPSHTDDTKIFWKQFFYILLGFALISAIIFSLPE